MMPIALQEGSPRHRLYVRSAWALAALALLYAPLAAELGLTFGSVNEASRIGQLNTVIAVAVAILGLQIVTGYSGQLALGQSAFVGVGAYTTVILVADHHWSYYATVPVTIVVCFLAGLLVGIPSTRVKGAYLAIVTLVLAFVFPSIVLRLDWLTGGPNGKGPPRTQGKLLPPSWMPFADAGRLAGPLWVYCVSIALATALFVLARNFVRSRPGRALITMRDHEPAAVALGVNVALYKAVAFGVSAVYGGLAGSILMMNRPFVTDGLFNMRMSIFLVAGLVIGGIGTVSGAIPGALAYVFVPYYLTTWAFDQRGLPPGVRQVTRPLFVLLHPAGGDAGEIFFGFALVLLTFVLPGGFVSGVRRLRARVVTIVPNPAWVPVGRDEPKLDARRLDAQGRGGPRIDAPSFGALRFDAPGRGEQGLDAPGRGEQELDAPRFDALGPGEPRFDASRFDAPGRGAPARGDGPPLTLPSSPPERITEPPAPVNHTAVAGGAPIPITTPEARSNPAGTADDPDSIWRR